MTRTSCGSRWKVTIDFESWVNRASTISSLSSGLLKEFSVLRNPYTVDRNACLSESTVNSVYVLGGWIHGWQLHCDQVRSGQ